MYEDNKGFKYELIANKYLQNKGYKILETNFTSRFGEIDIIALYEDTLIFVEVKARKNTEFGYPREYVTTSKTKKIISTANYYLLKNKYDDINCRFDVIEIFIEEKRINHIENAFEV